jgi:hypothetical protein
MTTTPSKTPAQVTSKPKVSLDDRIGRVQAGAATPQQQKFLQQQERAGRTRQNRQQRT